MGMYYVNVFFTLFVNVPLLKFQQEPPFCLKVFSFNLQNPIICHYCISRLILVDWNFLANKVGLLSIHLRAKLSRSPRSCKKHSGKLGNDFNSFFKLGGLRIPMISFLMLVLSLWWGFTKALSFWFSPLSQLELFIVTSLKREDILSSECVNKLKVIKFEANFLAAK